MDKSNRLKDYIAVTTKQPKSEAGRKRFGGLHPKRKRLNVGADGEDTSAAVTPETGEQVRPKASHGAQFERGNLLPVPRHESARIRQGGSSIDPRSVGQNTYQKTTLRSGEGIAQKQRPAVMCGIGPRGDGDDDMEKEGRKPQGRKTGMILRQASCWGEIPWKEVQADVYQLAHPIYVAAKTRRYERAKHLQQLMVRSFAARLYAVRMVCQINSGRNSAGVDGVCRLSDLDKWNLAEKLDLEEPHGPLLRKWIPKPGKQERRPLSLPTIKDRCRARLVALALEPEVEARLHRDVYGFRPGRSPKDAMASIRNFTNKLPQGKFVLDADIQDFFGSVSRSFLMDSLKLSRPIKQFIRSMLHAPTVDGGRMISTTGIPQGSPLSPVLANLVLSGLHAHVEQHFHKLRDQDPQTAHWKTPAVIIYADDLVAIHKSAEALQHTRTAIEDFLRPRGLRLHPDKTCIRHTLVECDGPPGFDFLGFNVRSFAVGKFKKATGSSGLQSLIRPSAKSQKRHHEKLAFILRINRHAPIGKVIRALNRCIRGWVNYHGTENSAATFSREDHILFWMIWHFLGRRHQGKASAHKLYQRYWPWLDGRKRFRDPDSGECLLSHADTPIEPHIKVKGEASFYDGNRPYWSTRLKRLHPLTRARRELREREEEQSKPDSGLEAENADEQEAVWLLVPPDRAVGITGEPDAMKVARPVLKERAGRRRSARL